MRDYKGLVALTLLTIALGFVIYDIYKNPYARIVSIALPSIVIAMNFYTLYGDWLPFRRGPQVNTLSGITGTQIGQAVQDHGGYETRWVAFPRNMVHKEVKVEREGGLYWLWDFLTGTITLPMEGKTWQWIDIPSDDLENPNGCILFLGRVDGGNLHDPDILYAQKHLDRLSTTISYVMTAMSKLEEQVANIANVKNLDAEQMAQHLQGIADKVKNIKILTRGQSGSDMATIGQEMG